MNRERDRMLVGLSSIREIFSPDFYLSAYPDVENAGLDPWDHFEKFGVKEGRSPNPYIDPSYMASTLGLPVSDVLIEVFTNKKYWAENTSRYVDIQNFALNGPWDGITHPIKQLMHTNQHREPWVKFAPYFSDLSTFDGKSVRLAAVSILEHVNGSRFRFSRPKEYLLGVDMQKNLVLDSEEQVLCIPGFTIAANGRAYSLSKADEVLSPDKSGIRQGNTLTIYEYGDTIRSKSVVIAPTNLRSREAMRWLNELDPTSAVVPASADQEFLFRYCIVVTDRKDVRILPYGSQSLVATKQVLVSSPRLQKPRRVFRRPEKLRRGSLLIVGESITEIQRQSEKISILARRGAKICVSNNETVPIWLNYFSHAKVVISCGDISWLDLWVKRSVPIIKIDNWD